MGYKTLSIFIITTRKHSEKKVCAVELVTRGCPWLDNYSRIVNQYTKNNFTENL
jgi:hypothetical protein